MISQTNKKENLKKALISVVILEYKSGTQLRNCVRSFYEATPHADIEIIISSNSCYDEETRLHLTKEFERETIIFNPVNGGFAYGMNRGLELAVGEYIIVCNQDVEMVEGIVEMVQYMKTFPRTGAMSPVLKSRSGIVQDSFRRYVTLPRLLQRNLLRLLRPGLMKYDYPAGEKPFKTDWLCGAFIMINRQVLNSVGRFDEKYFLYGEDVDMCTRIRLAGYDVVLFPKAITLYEGSRRARKLLNRNFLFFFRSHISLWRKFGFFKAPPVDVQKIIVPETEAETISLPENG
jgi:GT2 family glycosyltransferase